MTNYPVNFEELIPRIHEWAQASKNGQENEKRAVRLANVVWKGLVSAVGEAKAKRIMLAALESKKTGAPSDDGFNNLICQYIREFGVPTSDAKIAKRIYDSKPYYVRCQSGAFGVASSEIGEGNITLGRDEVVERTPTNKKLGAVRQQVRRLRDEMIEADLLPADEMPKGYGRKPYVNDG